MRDLLIKKSEEIILNGKWVHNQQVLRPHKIFSDLEDFYNKSEKFCSETPATVTPLKSRYGNEGKKTRVPSVSKIKVIPQSQIKSKSTHVSREDLFAQR